MFLKNRNISSKIKRSKVTDYAALKLCISINGSLTISVYQYDMHCVLEYILQKLKYKVLVHNYVIDKRYQIQIED